eukprot:CAMPEP_0113941292 /NCGR_PEP_ID=MMETSP1339-20121228/7240_1 /TAXON_ID=94617 /ORGANISM="Fibrocapsa japonica" /LENGTH=242 /DNA_ID=CAMNT_0000945395 /DNA_START=191 /DNA_END=919 /DNA_ORIENTATION=+ /assembly_acc=CAM_ASM_000762
MGDEIIVSATMKPPTSNVKYLGASLWSIKMVEARNPKRAFLTADVLLDLGLDDQAIHRRSNEQNGEPKRNPAASVDAVADFYSKISSHSMDITVWGDELDGGATGQSKFSTGSGPDAAYSTRPASSAPLPPVTALNYFERMRTEALGGPGDQGLGRLLTEDGLAVVVSKITDFRCRRPSNRVRPGHTLTVKTGAQIKQKKIIMYQSAWTAYGELLSYATIELLCLSAKTKLVQKVPEWVFKS